MEKNHHAGLKSGKCIVAVRRLYANNKPIRDRFRIGFYYKSRSVDSFWYNGGTESPWSTKEEIAMHLNLMFGNVTVIFLHRFETFPFTFQNTIREVKEKRLEVKYKVLSGKLLGKVYL